jgi:hypothetical protein
MKRQIIAGLAILSIAVSCKKKTDNTPAAAPNVYMSTTAGNTWTYETVNVGNPTITTNIVTATSRDSAIGGKIYRVYTTSNGTGNEYYNISSSDYFSYRNFVGQTNNNVELNYLKTNVAVGAKWTQTANVTISGVSLPVTVNYTLELNAGSRTVNGKNYTDVIKVAATLSSISLPPNSLTSDIQNFYAPKVGLIESKTKITTTLVANGNIDQVTTLKSTNF